VRDLKFLGPKTLLILWATRNSDEEKTGGRPAASTLLLAIPVQAAKITYRDFAPGAPIPRARPSRDALLGAFWSAAVTGLPGSPVRMEVLPESESRGKIPARVCVLGEDGVTYKVFALPGEAELLREKWGD
jgi:anaphase-promoting complex subunit 4